MPITCTKCGAPKRVRTRTPVRKGQLSRTLYCPACQAAAVSRYKRRNPDKVAAHRAVATARKAGRLRPGVCEVCGSPEVEAHHDDYSRRLAVRWFCREHHRAQHSRKKG